MNIAWTKCRDHQPKAEGYYLAWAKPMTKSAECYFDGNTWWANGYCELSVLPTHWAPMPAIPFN